MGVAALAAWLVLGSEERGSRTLAESRESGTASGPGASADGARPVPVPAEELGAPREPLGAPTNAREPAPGIPVATASSGGQESALQVLVLEANGAPAAGAPVELSVWAQAPAVPVPSSSFVCEADGIATIPLSKFGSGTRPAASGKFRYAVEVAVPLDDPPRIDFGTEIPPPGMVTLRLPPAGRLIVHVLRAAGEPVMDRATVYVSGRSMAGGFSHSLGSASVRAGKAEFAWIGLGLELELRAASDDRATPDAEAKLSGPKSPGETVGTTIRLGKDWPRVLLRAVDEHHAPLPGIELHLRVVQDPLSPQLARLPTDAGGRCELQVLGRHQADNRRTLEIEVQGPVARRGEVDLSFELEHEGPTDLGDVVLFAARSVLLAAGRVADDRGPVPGARVELWSRSKGYRERFETITDEGGRFELRGLPLDGGLWVMASAAGHASSSPLDVQPGSSGLALDLPRALLLEIELLLDEPLGRESVQLVLVTGSRSMPLPVRGRTEVPLGIHDLEVSTSGGLYSERIEGLHVDAGPEGIDPRLRPLDLRGRVRPAVFDLREGQGTPLRETWVHASLETGGRGSARTSREGRLILAVPLQASSIGLAPDGFAARTVAIRDAPQEVVFTPR